MGDLAPTRRARVTAVLSVLLAVVLLWHCPGLARTASYLGVLSAVLGVLGATAAVRLWQGCRCAAPATTLAVSASVLTGLLLDLGLPDVDGLEVCRRIRDAGSTVPILMLTARGGELDRVVGLDVGADDYLAKPFGLAELHARVRALLRRGGLVPAASTRPPARVGLRVDGDARRVWVGDDEVPLTVKEFDVLAVLWETRGAVVTRERLMDDVWDENWFGSTKTLDVTIGRLRQKLEDASSPARVVTVRGVGFRIEDDAPDA